MATMTMLWFDHAMSAAFNKEIDILDDSIKLAFLDSTLSPDQAVDDYWDDVVANEVTGTNLPAYGTAIANDGISFPGSHVWKYDGDDISIGSVTASDLKYGILMDATPGTDASKPLLAMGTIDSPVSPAAGTLSVTWAAGGILTGTA
jgi:hypothetical protein